MNTTTVPLIHTTRGNLPAADLTHEVEWRVAGKVIHFTERYRAEDGEVVRQDAHVCVMSEAMDAEANQSTPNSGVT